MLTPRSYGGFRPLSRLGIGGSGVVHLALGPGRRLVALKAPFRQRMENPARRTAFCREGELLERLHHPFLVGFHAADGEAEAPWMAMEYLPGAPLSEVLERGPLELVEALDVLEDAARVLEHLHAHGVLHRDLKPSNLFCTHAGRTVLLDLGLAVEAAAATGSSGTFLYAAPEQNRGEAVDARADLWSLGAVAFEVLTGSRALGGSTLPAALREQAEDGVPDPRDFAPLVPSELAELVVAATRSAPDRRPPDAAAFGGRLASLRRELEASRPAVFGIRRGRRAAREALARGDHAAASRALMALAADAPGDPWPAWLAACAARQRGDVRAAREQLARAQALGLDPDLRLREFGRLQLQEGDREGLTATATALASAPDPLARALRTAASLGELSAGDAGSPGLTPGDGGPPHHGS